MPDLIRLDYLRPEPADQIAGARAFHEDCARRRSVREFSSDPLPDGLLEWLVRAAGAAPSGAHRQPWRFVAVTDPALKREIRVGLAVGFLLVAIHRAGLVTLTHTRSPMGFLGSILRRPKNERPFLLLPLGYPASGARVPRLERKPLDAILVWNRADSPSNGR